MSEMRKREREWTSKNEDTSVMVLSVNIQENVNCRRQRNNYYNRFYNIHFHIKLKLYLENWARYLHYWIVSITFSQASFFDRFIESNFHSENHQSLYSSIKDFFHIFSKTVSSRLNIRKIPSSLFIRKIDVASTISPYFTFNFKENAIIFSILLFACLHSIF